MEASMKCYLFLELCGIVIVLFFLFYSLIRALLCFSARRKGLYYPQILVQIIQINFTSQLTFICSKSTIQKLENGTKHIQS